MSVVKPKLERSSSIGGILKKSPLFRSRKTVEDEDATHRVSHKDENKIAAVGTGMMRRSLSSPELLYDINAAIQTESTQEDIIQQDQEHHDTDSLPFMLPTPAEKHPHFALEPYTPTTRGRANAILLPTLSERPRIESDFSFDREDPGRHDDDFLDGFSDEDYEDEDEEEQDSDVSRKRNYHRSSAAYIDQGSIRSRQKRRRNSILGCCWCNFTSQDKPNWNQISAFIVRNAPCFWCCGERIESSITNRTIVMRLNILCLVIALIQVAVGFFVFYVTCLTPSARREVVNKKTSKARYWREALIPNLWTPTGSIMLLAVVGLAISITILLSRRSIRQFDIKGSIRYLWALYWFIPFEFFFVVNLVDYQRTTKVWVEKFWSTSSLGWFREIFCEANTADTTCRSCSPDDNECNKIRNAATTLMLRSSYAFFYSNAAVGSVLILLLVLTLTMLERLITAPIVQKSKERNVPLWLVLPTIGCLAAGGLLLYSPSSVLNENTSKRVYWIGACYMSTGGAFGFSALLGWFMSAKTVYNPRDRTRKLLSIYLFIAMMCLTIAAIGSIASASIIFSVNLVKIITNQERGELACFIDSACTCSNCPKDYCGVLLPYNGTQTLCPEWSINDVLKVMRTELKLSASIACVFLIYAFGALRFSINLLNNVKKYEIDYV